MMSEGLWLRSLAVLWVTSGLLIAGCSTNNNDSANTNGDVSPVSVDDSVDDLARSESSQLDTVEQDITAPSPESNTDDLREIWSQLWIASGLTPEERGPAVEKLADSLDPEVAAAIPELVLVPEEREVLSDPAFEMAADGSINIQDCVLYTPPIKGLFAPHIHKGHATPDGNGGWTINQATQEGQGCVPKTMAKQVLTDYHEYLQALKDAGNPPNPDHPSLPATMTGTYLEGMIEAAKTLVDNDWHYVDFDKRHPEIVEIPGSTLVVIRDCFEYDPRSGLFRPDGSRREGAVIAEAGKRGRSEVRMRLEGGQWKTEQIDITSNADCEIAPTAFALPEI